jgi:uncharacterized protein (DUF2235 family)
VPEVDPQSLQGKPPDEASATEPPGSTRATQASIQRSDAYPSKSIFVCCDGTGNEFAAKDSPDGNSNVVKLYTALKLNVHQVAYYHPGVGTLGDPTKMGMARKWSVIKGLAFGEGFQDNVLDAYRYLMQHYAANDRVYLFGFSRGAYTARALAGLLHGYGLLCRGNEGHIPYAWRMYTEKVATQKELNAHTIVPDTTFRDTFSHRDFSIHFIGLWDTVSSVGWITTPLRLLDMAQNSTIQRGRHAVSIDERRCFYQDNLWGKPIAVDVPVVLRGKPEAASIPARQDLLQVWFSGVHSDVGGSYPQLQSGLANITLKWMIDETRKAGAVFDEPRVRMVLGTPGPGEPTAETTALAPLYEKPKSFTLHRSLESVWWLPELLPHRYYDKDDSSVKRRIPFGAYRKIPAGALIHPTVRSRFSTHPCYRPKNVTSDELVDAPGSEEVTGEGEHYLQFAPRVCRDYKLRQNWFVVFAVTALEFGIPIYALLLLAVEAFRHVHPERISTGIWNGCLWVERSTIAQRLLRMGPFADFIGVILLVSVSLIAGKLIRLATSIRA